MEKTYEKMIEDLLRGIDFKGCETVADAIHALYSEVGEYIEDYDNKDFYTEDLIESGVISFYVMELEDTYVYIEYDVVKYNEEDALESQIKNIKTYIG